MKHYNKENKIIDQVWSQLFLYEFFWSKDGKYILYDLINNNINLDQINRISTIIENKLRAG